MQGICVEDQEAIQEFLVESRENLGRLDLDIVELEKRPKDSALLGSVFRTIHTIKGASGFLALKCLEQLTHEAENLLSQLRDGKRDLTSGLVSLILETVDATRNILNSIETTGSEGDAQLDDLIDRLRRTAVLSAPARTVPAPHPLPATPELTSNDIHRSSHSPLNSGDSVVLSQQLSEEVTPPSGHGTESNIRVGVGLLDKLMDLVGELVLTRNQILQFNSQREDAVLSATSQRLNLITSELQEGVMKTRMQPIGVAWHNLPRVVRDMAVSLGKQIQIKMDGADTELDRTIIEAIKDPLVHLVRNSCDHGIEPAAIRIAAGKPATGTMSLRAYHEGGQVNIEVTDDGAGIDLECIRAKAIERGLLRPEQVDRLGDRETLNLVFQPGFSTAAKVTNISGRGVGMDVVRSQIEKIGGVVDIFSNVRQGTAVKIRIPLTLAIIPGLIITSGGEQFVIPQVSLLELIRLEADSASKHIEHVHGAPVYRRRGTLLPITYLNEILGLPPAREQEAINIIVLQSEDQQFGLVVDGISDTQEIVVKPLCKQLKGVTLYAGATIMGDGRVALILDVLGLGQRSGVFGHAREQARAQEETHNTDSGERQRLLLFRAAGLERIAIPLSLVDRLEEFPRSAIESAGSGQVIQYRNRILPLISLASVLQPDAACPTDEADLVRVIVIQDGETILGMVVDEILDIAEESLAIRQVSTRRGLLGSAVVGKRVTDFLDLNEFLAIARRDWLAVGCATDDKTVLLVDPSAFSRRLLKASIDIAGYRTLEASCAGDALRLLEQRKVQIIVASIDSSPDIVKQTMSAIHAHPEWARIPAMAIATFTEQIVQAGIDASWFTTILSRPETRTLLDHLRTIVQSAGNDAPTAVSA